LRQLARLESIRIEKEIGELRTEEDGLNKVLGSRKVMRDLIVSEIKADVKKFGDERRTLIEAAERITAKAVSVPDEACTVILSKNGWIRLRSGHDSDAATLSFKDGDELLSLNKTRTVHPVVLIDSGGRAYTVTSSDIPGGRSDGVPVASLLGLPAKAKIVAMCAAEPETQYLFSTSAGYGFIAVLKHLVSRQRAGKAFMNIGEKDVLLPPVEVGDSTLIVALGSNGKLLAFPISEMKVLSGGKGVIVLGVGEGERMLSAITVREGGVVKILGQGRGGKRSEQVLNWYALQDYVQHRARKGVLTPVKFKVESVLAE